MNNRETGEPLGTIQERGFMVAIRRHLEKHECSCANPPTLEDVDGDETRLKEWLNEALENGHRSWCNLADTFSSLKHGIVPDAFAIVPDLQEDENGKLHQHPTTHRVFAFEVEDAHRINEAKLRKYIDLWWLLDDTETLNLELVIVDRYGEEKTLDLGDLAWRDAFYADDEQNQSEPNEPGELDEPAA